MLEELNKQQLEAVKHVDGPVMVFAGAGSGKTKALTNRIAYMINECCINSYNILAITFTNKATKEMKSRLDAMIGKNSYDATITTFHSFCARILRYEIDHIGYMRNFTIIDEDEQLKIVGDVLEKNNIDKKKTPTKYMCGRINYMKTFGIKSVIQLENDILNHYEVEMKNLNLLDFEDLLIKVNELFTYFPDVLKKYRSRYQYVLIDEFQDTNLLQYRIAKMLTEESRNLFVVGDDDQSIYSFRGANYDNMHQIKKDYPEITKYFLTQNYRSTQRILDGCNQLINNNKDREAKELFSDITGSESDVQIYLANNEKEEADYIANKILIERQCGFSNYNDFAVLYRSSVLLRNVELCFIKEKIPYRIFGGISYLRRKEIKDIIAIFKLIINFNDMHSFKRIVANIIQGLGDATIKKIEEVKIIYKLNLFDAIDAVAGVIPKAKYQLLSEFKEMIIDYNQKINNMTYVDFFDDLIAKIDYKKYLEDNTESKDEFSERWNNLMEFKSILYSIEPADNSIDRIFILQEAFDDAILSEDKHKNKESNVDAVTLSTIHSVKGLEFSVVFVIGLEEDIFPNSRRIESEYELEEERRIAYVAMTRAKSKLYLTCTKRRLIYGHYNSNIQSRFLLEFGKAKSRVKKQTVSNNNSSLYNLGDYVVHDSFGEGIIVAINDDIGQICFVAHGSIKSIILNHPSLKKKE